MRVSEMQAEEGTSNADSLWRRRLAGDFSALHAVQERRRDAGATRHRASP